MYYTCIIHVGMVSIVGVDKIQRDRLGEIGWDGHVNEK